MVRRETLFEPLKRRGDVARGFEGEPPAIGKTRPDVLRCVYPFDRRG
jgi:hypothetical protein